MSCHSCPQNCNSIFQAKWNCFKLFQGNKVTITPTEKATPTIILIGSHNVGKTLLFNLLTSARVRAENHPNSTVKFSRGQALIAGKTVTVIDTPGMYSLFPVTEEERVSRDFLLAEKAKLFIHVVDAKKLGKMLTLTFQMIETQLPVMLAINMLDEAEKLGIWIDGEKLENTLSIPVVTMAAKGKLGIQELKAKVATYV